MANLDVCIRGNGAVGLTLALALARQGLRVGVVGPAPAAVPAHPDVRAYALNAASRRLLTDLRVWDALRALDPARPVYVEAESKKVGNVTVPETLIAAMRASDCLRIDLPDDERVALLLEDYPFFVSDPDFFCQRLDTLVALRGRAVVDDWKARVAAGRTEHVVRELLALHYDPGYASSTQRNFQGYADAPRICISDRSPGAMRIAAKVILQGGHLSEFGMPPTANETQV